MANSTCTGLVPALYTAAPVPVGSWNYCVTPPGSPALQPHRGIRKLAYINKTVELAIHFYNQSLDSSDIDKRANNLRTTLQQACEDVGRVQKKDKRGALRAQVDQMRAVFHTHIHDLTAMREKLEYAPLGAPPTWWERLQASFQIIPGAMAHSLTSQLTNVIQELLGDTDLYVFDLTSKAEYHKSQANFYLKNNDNETALTHAKKAVELAPEDYEIHDILGRAFFSLARFEEAHQAFSKCLTLGAIKVANTLCNRGVSALRLNRLDEARGDFLEALRLKPSLTEEFGEIHYFLGLTLLQDPDEAIHAFERCIQYAKDEMTLGRTHLELAELRAQKGQFALASQLLLRLKERHSVSLSDSSARSKYFILQGLSIFGHNPEHFHRAAPFFNKSRRLGEDVDSYLLSKFVVMQRLDLARTYLTHRTEEEPHPTTFLHFSNIAFLEGNVIEGIQLFRKAAAHPIVGNTTPITKELLRHLEHLEQEFESMTADEYRSHLESIATSIQQMTDPQMPICAGTLFFLSGRYEKAWPLLESAVQQKPAFAPLLELARALYEERVDSAKTSYTHILDLLSLLAQEDIAAMIQSKAVVTLIQAWVPLCRNAASSDPVLRTLFTLTPPPQAASFPWGWIAAAACGVFGLIELAAWWCRPKPLVTVRVTVAAALPPKRIRSTLPKPSPIEEPTPPPDTSKAFRDTLEALFCTSKVGLTVKQVKQEVETRKAVLECALIKGWPFLEEHRTQYMQILSALVGEVQSQSLYDVRRWVITQSVAKIQVVNEALLAKAKSAIEHLDQLVLDKRDKKVTEEAPKWSVDLPALLELRRCTEWETLLQRLLRPYGRVTVNREIQEVMLVSLLPSEELEEHFQNGVGLNWLQKALFPLTEPALEITWNGTQALITIPKGQSVTGQATLQPLDDLIVTSEVVDSQQPEPAPPQPSGQITIEHRAQGRPPEIIWRAIRAAYEHDQATIRSLCSIIRDLEGLAGKKEMLFAKKFLLVRFFELYKRLSFFELRPEERENANTARNALMHHFEWIEEDEVEKLCRACVQMKRTYEVPYTIDEAITIRYAISWIDLTFIDFLTKEVPHPDADQDKETLSLGQLQLFSSLFNQQIPDAMQFAHKCGLILAMREMMQRHNMRPQTRARLGLQLISDLGDLLAHGGIDAQISNEEIRQVALLIQSRASGFF